jgi:rubrerythrin
MPLDSPDTEMAIAFATLTATAARNRLFSQKARKEGNEPLAALLGAMAVADDIQARRALIYLRGKAGETSDYAAALLSDKRDLFAEIFPRLKDEAVRSGQENMADTYERYGQVSRNHHEMLREVVDEGREAAGTYHICQVCGYLVRDEIPDRCPICNAPAKKFSTADG